VLGQDGDLMGADLRPSPVLVPGLPKSTGDALTEVRMRRAIVISLVPCALVVACESDPFAPPSPPAPMAAALAPAAVPNQAAADEISANIQSAHLLASFPYPTILDPRFASSDPASPDYNTVAGYVHAGDAAIWTGHYLAAEAFRYAVTGSADAKANAQRALHGIQGLVDVTRPVMPDLLARFLWPTDWEYSDEMQAAEASHGVYDGALGDPPRPHKWLANTTRDQYSGVFLGLGVAYDLIDDPTVRNRISNLVTRMLMLLLRNAWNVPRPGGGFSTTFWGHPDKQLSLLQVGRRVNPRAFETIYLVHRTALMGGVSGPARAECQDQHGSYYKFNLDHIILYNLIRLEEPGVPRELYSEAFHTLRGCTAHHKNAHFNMIERGLEGPSATRDADTRDFLALWLTRPRRDPFVDLRGKYEACGENRACAPVPVDERPPTDFLWQRSPFLLFGGGDGTIETAAIDYLLPYWMARYYGVITE
jgi:hypothetical protein